MPEKQKQFNEIKIEEMYEKIFLMIDGATNEIPEEETKMELDETADDFKVKHNWITNKGAIEGLKKLFVKEFGLREDYELGDNDEEEFQEIEEKPKSSDGKNSGEFDEENYEDFLKRTKQI